VQAVSRLVGPVLADYRWHVELWVALVDAPHPDDTPSPKELACTAREQRDVVDIIDVKAVHDGAVLQGGSQIARREEPGTPLGDRLVPHARVGDVPVKVLALKEVASHLHTQLLFHHVHLPALVVEEVQRSDAPARARVAELAQHNGPRDRTHLDQMLPHMALLHQ
jgi:hypothetical protein